MSLRDIVSFIPLYFSLNAFYLAVPAFGRAALSAHTAQALGSGPVSASIANGSTIHNLYNLLQPLQLPINLLT